MAKKKKVVEESFFNEKAETPKSKSNFKKIFIFFAGIIIVFTVIAGILYLGLLNNKTSTSTPEGLIAAVGKHINIPEDEIPTIATVSDVKKLADQPFFSSAKNGDKVLVYKKNKKAILYRPETDKIINLSIINPPSSAGKTTTNEQNLSVNPSPTPQILNIEILNGTNKSGLAKNAQKRIEDAGIKIEAELGNAVEDQQSTLIVDISGNHSSQVAGLVKIIGGKSGKLPKSEAKPEGKDILIILGDDYESQ